MLRSVLRAFSIYSRIPVPRADWNGENMRYAICFLPLVGAVIGAAQGLLFFCLSGLPCGPVFRGALLTALPVIVSGGIHLDGFLDTCDAIHSYKSREERLQILRDPHAGAFAVLCGVVYGLLEMGVWSEAKSGTIALLCMTFVLSRSLSAWTALTFPKAKKDGMLRQETDPVPAAAPAAMLVTTALVCAAMLRIRLVPGLCAVAAAAVTLLYYRKMAMRDFGGITGDLSGWFTQTCELVTALVIILAGAVF